MAVLELTRVTRPAAAIPRTTTGTVDTIETSDREEYKVAMTLSKMVPLHMGLPKVATMVGHPSMAAQEDITPKADMEVEDMAIKAAITAMGRILSIR